MLDYICTAVEWVHLLGTLYGENFVEKLRRPIEISKTEKWKLRQSEIVLEYPKFCVLYVNSWIWAWSVVAPAASFPLTFKNCMGQKWLHACARASGPKTTKIAPRGVFRGIPRRGHGVCIFWALVYILKPTRRGRFLQKGGFSMTGPILPTCTCSRSMWQSWASATL